MKINLNVSLIFKTMFINLCVWNHIMPMGAWELGLGLEESSFSKSQAKDCETIDKLLQTLPQNPSLHLRKIVEFGHNLGLLEYLRSRIHGALDKGGQFDLLGIDETAVGWFLHLAVSSGDCKTVHAILSAGKRISSDHNNKWISGKANYPSDDPLLHGTWDPCVSRKLQRMDKEMFYLLISFGANVNDIDSLGSTMLYKAVLWGNADVVQFLLSQGAKANIKNKEGRTPLDLLHKEITEKYKLEERDKEEDKKIFALLLDAT